MALLGNVAMSVKVICQLQPYLLIANNGLTLLLLAVGCTAFAACYLNFGWNTYTYTLTLTSDSD